MLARIGFVMLLFILATNGLAQNLSSEPRKVALNLPDQYERRFDVSQWKGDVVVILYGDKDGMPLTKGIGESIHVHYHPTAKGQPPAQSNKAPVTPVPNLPEGARSPDVKVVPVICFGRGTEIVKNVIRNRVRKEAPENLVLLDFENKMKDQFGLKENQPNLIVIDSQGRLRLRMTGQLDADSYTKLIQTVDALRKEAVER